jgi:PIN domain-containing protein
MANLYVLVDFENVQPDLEELADAPVRVRLFVGAKQQEQRHRYGLMKGLVALGGKVELIEITRSGSNAVDMHIAWYIGGLLEREPTARIHIISGDTDFDPLLEFLAARGVDCRRTKNIAELAPQKAPRVAAPRTASKPSTARPAAPRQPRSSRARVASLARTPAPSRAPAPDKLLPIVQKLRSMNGKPSNRSKLAQTLANYFKQHGGEQSAKEVESAIDELLRRKLVTEDGKKLRYDLGS